MPDLVGNGVAWFFAWLFATAALHKFRDPVYYRELLANWLPGLPGAQLAGWLAGALEVAIAILLLAPAARPAGLLTGAMLLLLYAVLMASQLARGRRDVKCGCAGPASAVTISPVLLLRNMLCAGLALVALLPPAVVGAGVTGVGLSLSVATFLALAYLASEQIIANAQLMAGEK